jgi:hypothetical protein
VNSQRTWIAAGATLVVLVAACSSSSPRAVGPSTTAATGASVPASPPDFRVVLDDGGLHLPPGPTRAGIYRVCFEDRRTKRRPDDYVVIRFQPSGPDIELGHVATGHSDDITLLQNLGVYPMINDKFASVPIENQLDVRPTAQYSSPVT